MYVNPCTSKWNLALSPADYLHNSARFYLYGEQGAPEVYNTAVELKHGLQDLKTSVDKLNETMLNSD
jgi:hypothetical protein